MNIGGLGSDCKTTNAVTICAGNQINEPVGKENIQRVTKEMKQYGKVTAMEELQVVHSCRIRRAVIM